MCIRDRAYVKKIPFRNLLRVATVILVYVHFNYTRHFLISVLLPDRINRTASVALTAEMNTYYAVRLT